MDIRYCHYAPGCWKRGAILGQSPAQFADSIPNVYPKNLILDKRRLRAYIIHLFRCFRI